MKNRTLLVIVLLICGYLTYGQQPPKQDSTSAVQILSMVEQMPEFPGGEAAMQRLLLDSIHYPEKAKEQNIQGRVYVEFIVKDDGTLSDLRVLRSPSQLLSDEAIRVVKLMPKFKPGKQGGKPVNVRFTIPVSFRITDH